MCVRKLNSICRQYKMDNYWKISGIYERYISMENKQCNGKSTVKAVIMYKAGKT